MAQGILQWPDRPKTMDSETELQAIEANLGSSTLKVSGELSISQITFMTLAKASGAAKLCLHYQIIAKLLTYLSKN